MKSNSIVINNLTCSRTLMIERWATLNTKGQVSRLDSTKRHTDALPVIYPPQPEYNPATHQVKQQSMHQWIVSANTITVTYALVPIPFEDVKHAKLLDLEYVFEDHCAGKKYSDKNNQLTYQAIRKQIASIQDQVDLYMFDVYHAYMDHLQTLQSQ